MKERTKIYFIENKFKKRFSFSDKNRSYFNRITVVVANYFKKKVSVFEMSLIHNLFHKFIVYKFENKNELK